MITAAILTLLFAAACRLFLRWKIRRARRRHRQGRSWGGYFRC